MKPLGKQRGQMVPSKVMTHIQLQDFLKDYEVVDGKQKDTADGGYHLFRKVIRNSDGFVLVILSKHSEENDEIIVIEEDIENYSYWWP